MQSRLSYIIETTSILTNYLMGPSDINTFSVFLMQVSCFSHIKVSGVRSRKPVSALNYMQCILLYSRALTLELAEWVKGGAPSTSF